MGAFISLVGDKFSRLLVVSRAENKGIRTAWNCVCDCGKEVVVRGCDLKNGKTRSCGCYNLECIIDRNTTHGLKGHPLYKTALNILHRCSNPKSASYKYYGARGIKCLIGDNPEEVLKVLESIDGYFEGAQIDRIDNDGHYEIGNLRWVTRSDNCHNTRSKVGYSSKVRGVSYCKGRGTWVSEMTISGVKHRKIFYNEFDAIYYRESLEEYYLLKYLQRVGEEAHSVYARRNNKIGGI